MEEKKKKEPFIAYMSPLLIGVFMTVSVCLIFINYRTKVHEYETRTVTSQLEQLANQNAAVIKNKLNDALLIVKTAAQSFVSTDDITADSAIDRLKKISGNTDFNQMALISRLGNVRTTDGNPQTPLQLQVYFADAMRGNSGVSTITASQFTGNDIIIVYAPVKQENAYRANGVLYGIYEAENFNRLMTHEVITPAGYSHIFQSDGRFISLSGTDQHFAQSASIWDALSGYLADGNTDAVSHMKQAVSRGESGFIHYGEKQHTRIAYYSPIEFNDWYILTVIPESFIASQTETINVYGLHLFMQFLFSSAVAFCIFFYFDRKKHRKIMAMTKEMSAAVETFRITASFTSSYVFEYTPHTRTMISYSQPPEEYNIAEHMTDVPQSFVHREIVGGVFVEPLFACFQKIADGNAQAECKIQIRNKYGNLTWIKITLISIFSTQGEVLKAVGIIENINEQKMAEERMSLLKIKAEHDPLTGVFNRAGAQQRITDILRTNPDGIHGFMLCDLDRFKEINDTYGHQTGDELLKCTAKKLLELVRSSDLVIRMGGDEFAVFVINAKSMELVEKKAAEANKLIASIQLPGVPDATVTGSIGVAATPACGKTFDDLYRMADMALYKAKNAGRNQFCTAEKISDQEHSI